MERDDEQRQDQPDKADKAVEMDQPTYPPPPPEGTETTEPVDPDEVGELEREEAKPEGALDPGKRAAEPDSETMEKINDALHRVRPKND